MKRMIFSTRASFLSLGLAASSSLLLSACADDAASEDGGNMDETSDGSSEGSDSTGDSDTDSDSGSSDSSDSGGDTGGEGGENTLPDTIDDCFEETFLDPAVFQDPGGSSFSPDYQVSCDDTYMTVTGNNIPVYAFVQTTPNTLAEANRTHRIPLSPAFQDEPSRYTTLAVVGVSVGGTDLQTPSEAGDLLWGDPVYDSALDACNGHTGFGGAYHSHALVGTCFFSADDGSVVSPILGWAYDGYPVYGTMGCLDADCTEVVEMKSSYEELNNPTDCVDQSHAYAGDANEHDDGDEFLDECNGHIGPNGDYHYHATNTYPYILGCFRGTPGPDANLYPTQIDTQMEEACVDGECVGDGCGMMPPGGP